MKHPVLLLHTLGASGDTWSEVIGADQSRFSAPDLPGHGMRRDEVFETSKAVATALSGTGLLHVVGSGLGAFVALEVLRTAPERVASLVLAGFPAAGGPERVEATASTLKAIGVDGFATSYMEATLLRPHEGFARAMAAMRPEGLVSALAAALDWTTPAARTRTKVLRGEHDARVSDEAARSLAATLGADYVTLPVAGHVAYVDAPRGFREVLDAFHRAAEAQEEPS
ncbi:alpha/beta fold hydrolase [Herbidospora mongoliensis]|uniref:alpha/beta fold hydrolase n=1 Tax=Herbidospora mongoliensis TaxID=688067 RepID=UPI0012FCC41B|nr:alpha/beta hydrolase [Herbidospora mongoliensis]